MPSPESMGVAAIALGQSYAFFNQFMPPIADVRKADPGNTEVSGDIRMGEIAAMTGAVSVGLIVAWITKDPTPVYVSAIVCSIMIALYEYTLRAHYPGETAHA